MRIGEASFPSGIALLVDFGTLHLWQHTRPPVWPEAADDPAGDGLVDLQLHGPHAEHAGRELGRQWHPHFLYDVGTDDIGEIQQAIGQLAARGMSAGVAPLPQRVPHRTRVEYALRHGRGAGEVPFFAMNAVAVAGLPPGVRIPVVGTRTAENDGRWHEVTLEVIPNAPVANRATIGTVMVDCARLMFSDVDALATWDDAHSADGLADFAFWGLHAEGVARHFNAPPLGDGQFGWKNLSITEATARGSAIEQVKANDPNVRFATDFRPHTQSWKLLEQIRATPSESGVLDLGAARVTGFMTTWGDGSFTVYRDVDPQGRLVRIGVVFDDGEDDEDSDDESN
jgi:hypothetical protein